jgi:toxin ParE1/3/4
MPAVDAPVVNYGLELSGLAQNDVARILVWTQEAFGDTGRVRYEKLIFTALSDLRTNPVRTGVQPREDIGLAVRGYHLASGRKRVSGSSQVAKPRHWVFFRVKQDVVQVARLLHDSMDFSQHRV